MPPSRSVPPTAGFPRASAHELDERTFSRLTGVRSGKQSYYAELKRTKARLTSAVQALEGISAALVRTHDDPRALLEEVLRAAAGHLRSGWTMIALHDGVLATQTSRFLAVGPEGHVTDAEAELPGWLLAELSSARSGTVLAGGVEARLVRVPLILQDMILGRLVASREPGVTVEHADLWVLQILANQAAVSMHTAMLHSTGAELRQQAQQLYDEVARSSHDLQARTAELAQAERRLQVLRERELLDTERHRIADELHDSVAQYVLSAGLAVEVCRAEAADRDDSDAVQRMMYARDLIARAGDQVRSVVYALHHEPATEAVAALPELLQGLVAQYRPGLALALRLEGRPVALSPAAAQGLARIAGEALFNISIHAEASKAVVRLKYSPAGVSLWISDDGQGDPMQLRRLLRVEARGDSDGRHQGLASMARRAKDLGGTFAIRRSKLGGVRLEVRIPGSAGATAGGQPEEPS
jgi:signal transduction histidine kinase